MSREVIIKVLDREEIDAHARESFYIDEETHETKVELLAPYQNMGELIRCKDCKFNDGCCKNEALNSHLEPLGLDGGALFETSPDFYCAYGRRKEV